MEAKILKTERTTVERIPDRARYDEETIHAIIDSHFLCHVGFVDEGTPFVIPTAYCRIDRYVYIHGSSKSRMIGALSNGQQACLTITHIDGLVLARSAFHHSMNYRSVVLLAQAEPVLEEAAKMGMFEKFVEHVVPGRWAEVRWPNEQEMKATGVLRFPISEASAKIRTGDPKDDVEDMGMEVWAGVLPLEHAVGQAKNDAQLASGIALPKYLSSYKAPWSTERKDNLD